MAIGFEIRDNTGKVMVSTDDSLPRVFRTQRFAYDYSGSFSVPEFDDNYGMFYVTPCVFMMGLIGGVVTRWPDTESLSGTGEKNFMVHVAGIPTITWNNTTKIMSITPASMPTGWPRFTNHRPDYYISFINVNKRTDL